MADIRNSTSTIPPADSGMYGWERSLRSVSIALIVAIVLAATIGALGVRTSVASVSADGISVSVIYSAVTRPGLATPFGVEVATADGAPLPPALTVEVDSSYLAMFDDNGMEPTPASSFNTAESTSWTFEIPPGSDRFRVDLDARLEPAVQWGQDGFAAVVIDGAEMVRVPFHTWVMP